MIQIYKKQIARFDTELLQEVLDFLDYFNDKIVMEEYIKYRHTHNGWEQNIDKKA